MKKRAAERAPAKGSETKPAPTPESKKAGDAGKKVSASVKPPVGNPQHGIASYYSIKSNGGRVTASGKPLCDVTPTAAHRTLPFGTIVRVTRLKTGKSVEIPITDRGPYAKGRIIDLNLAAARLLGITPKDGIAKVKVEVVKKAPPKKK